MGITERDIETIGQRAKLQGDYTIKRDGFFQSVRGLCILCVVLIHCATGLEYKGIVGLTFNYDYWHIFRSFINFPIAIFIFLTAYFINVEQE